MSVVVYVVVVVNAGLLLIIRSYSFIHAQISVLADREKLMLGHHCVLHMLGESGVELVGTVVSR